MPEVIILQANKHHDRIENLGKQLLKPSSDRCNVVELWRVRLDRAFEQLDRLLTDDYRLVGD